MMYITHSPVQPARGVLRTWLRSHAEAEPLPQHYQRFILENQVLAQLMTKWRFASQPAIVPSVYSPPGSLAEATTSNAGFTA